MIFLKNKSLGLEKKNIIFIDNFYDPITKKEISSKGFKCETFKIHDEPNKVTKDIKACYKIYYKHS